MKILWNRNTFLEKLSAVLATPLIRPRLRGSPCHVVATLFVFAPSSFNVFTRASTQCPRRCGSVIGNQEIRKFAKKSADFTRYGVRRVLSKQWVYPYTHVRRAWNMNLRSAPLPRVTKHNITSGLIPLTHGRPPLLILPADGRHYP